MTPFSIDAIVLAGGSPDELSALEPGAPNKAFVPVGGVTLVARTIRALRAAPEVGRIVVVAPPEAFASTALASADERRASGATMTESLKAGLRGYAPGALLLVAASDLPILSPAAIAEFVNLAEKSEADIVYSCVEKSAHLAQFPDVPHTWAKLQDGTFCGGGLVALRPRAMPALERILGKLGSARKNPLALAAIFGPRILLRFAIGRLRVAHAERRASKLIGAPVAAAICTHADVAVNVDRVSDVELAEALLRARAAAGVAGDRRAVGNVSSDDGAGQNSRSDADA